jgi:hypothetical protein
MLATPVFAASYIAIWAMVGIAAYRPRRKRRMEGQ